MKRREQEPSATGIQPPAYLARFVWADWARDDDEYPSVAGRSRWRLACRAWADENGWTRRQLAGLHNPSWIAHGWADAPPEDGS